LRIADHKPEQETDEARYKLAADQQAVRALESQARALLAKLDGNPEIAVGDMPSFKQAQGGGSRTRDEPLGGAGAV
jgi:hypothetical protein